MLYLPAHFFLGSAEIPLASSPIGQASANGEMAYGLRYTQSQIETWQNVILADCKDPKPDGLFVKAI